jgi:NAD(P)-dependent dehydrogenase (short-subunit alcohol dehydrogenase family)
MADTLGGVALVTGGGRGIGASVALELAAAGMDVVVSGRTREQVEAVAAEVGGRALVGDVSQREDVARWFTGLEELDLLVNNAGISGPASFAWEQGPEDWWHVFEVNVLGAFLCSHAALPGMVERGRGRIVNVSSGAAYLPVPAGIGLGTAYGASKAALSRFTEALDGQTLGHGVRAFHISPGLVRTDMSAAAFGDDAPWTPPELAPRLVRVLASGRADALGGRYIHAEHDDIEELIVRADEVIAEDLNAIRVRRNA